MKIQLLGGWKASSNVNRERYADLKYAAMLVLGGPAVVYGSMYIIETLFDLFWR